MRRDFRLFFNWQTLQSRLCLSSNSIDSGCGKIPQRVTVLLIGIKLDGGGFVAPQQGAAWNAAFGYRLAVGEVESNRQVGQLYLTPLGG